MGARTRAYKCHITAAEVRHLPHTHTNMCFHHSEEADGEPVVKNELVLLEKGLLTRHPFFCSPPRSLLHTLLSNFLYVLLHTQTSVCPEVSDLTPLTSDSL